MRQASTKGIEGRRHRVPFDRATGHGGIELGQLAFDRGPLAGKSGRAVEMFLAWPHLRGWRRLPDHGIVVRTHLRNLGAQTGDRV